MEPNVIMEYIKPELLILIPVLMMIGKMCKESSKVKDEIIPIILGCTSIAICALYIIATSGLTPRIQDALICTFDIIVQGILLAGVSTWGHQCYKQLTKLKQTEEK